MPRPSLSSSTNKAVGDRIYYLELFKMFTKNKVRYLVVGGLGVLLHGVPRVTHDIDIIVSMDSDNITKLNRALLALGYVPRLPVDPNDLSDPKKVTVWIGERNLKAFSFYNKADPYKVVDVLLVHGLDFDRSFKGRTRKKIEGVMVNLISIDDLIEMKRRVGRPQDQDDVEMLSKIKKLSGGG